MRKLGLVRLYISIKRVDGDREKISVFRKTLFRVEKRVPKKISVFQKTIFQVGKRVPKKYICVFQKTILNVERTFYFGVSRKTRVKTGTRGQLKKGFFGKR